MSWDYSLVIVCAADDRAELNRLAALMGHGPDNIGVPLSADGHAPATHFGGRSWARASFIEILADLREGVLPPELVGEDPAGVQALMGRCTIETTQGVEIPRGQWETVTGGLGLAEVLPEEL